MAAGAEGGNGASQTACWRSFGGQQLVFEHQSTSTGTKMKFNVYVPPGATAEAKVPAILYLSGLTCTPDNVTQKAGAQQHAARRGVALIMPDTSPRGDGVEEGDSWDIGIGAGFYIDATEEPWSKHYKMGTYISTELLPVVAAAVPSIDTSRVGLTGHSMGGFGALSLGLRHTDTFRSVSAFSPIVHPTAVPWGQKVFGAYLGSTAAGEPYDPCAIAATYDGPARTVLISQGTADNFLERELRTADLAAAVGDDSKITLQVNMEDGYDHSYYFVASFIGQHIDFHADRLLEEGAKAEQ